ncbi:MAG: hypothetical protein HY720_02305 [Planctomycetes bacterium]|nr:hypothetical protein [Planctomycetota bacterium]
MNYDALTKRLDRLERWNRGLVGAMAVLSLVLVVFIVVAGWKSLDGRVEAEQIVLRDANGRVAAILDGPGLRLYDANGRNRASLSLDKDGSPHLYLFDENSWDGRCRAIFSLDKDGSPYLCLFDADENPVWRAP